MQKILTQIIYKGQVLPVNPTDLFIMSDLMSFIMQQRGESQERATEMAIREFVHLKLGEEPEKVQAKKLMNQAVEWDLTQDFGTGLHHKSLCKDVLLRHLKKFENADIA